jgi:hypothetical protein
MDKQVFTNHDNQSKSFFTAQGKQWYGHDLTETAW